MPAVLVLLLPVLAVAMHCRKGGKATADNDAPKSGGHYPPEDAALATGQNDAYHPSAHHAVVPSAPPIEFLNEDGHFDLPIRLIVRGHQDPPTTTTTKTPDDARPLPLTGVVVVKPPNDPVGDDARTMPIAEATAVVGMPPHGTVFFLSTEINISPLSSLVHLHTFGLTSQSLPKRPPLCPPPLLSTAPQRPK